MMGVRYDDWYLIHVIAGIMLMRIADWYRDPTISHMAPLTEPAITTVPEISHSNPGSGWTCLLYLSLSWSLAWRPFTIMRSHYRAHCPFVVHVSAGGVPLAPTYQRDAGYFAHHLSDVLRFGLLYLPVAARHFQQCHTAASRVLLFGSGHRIASVK